MKQDETYQSYDQIFRRIENRDKLKKKKKKKNRSPTYVRT